MELVNSRHNHRDYIRWTMRTMNFLIVKPSPLHIGISLGPKYLPYDLVLWSMSDFTLIQASLDLMAGIWGRNLALINTRLMRASVAWIPPDLSLSQVSVLRTGGRYVTTWAKCTLLSTLSLMWLALSVSKSMPYDVIVSARQLWSVCWNMQLIIG